MKENWDFDRDPLTALRRGDIQPFEAFVTLETPTFLAFFLRLGAGRADAEDLVQDLFLKLFRTASSYTAQDRFAAYAFRVARNSWIDRRRRHRLREFDAPAPGADGEQGGLEQVLPDGSEEPLVGLTRGEEADRVRAAVAQLPESHRLVFELGIVQELPYAQVSLALEIPVGTVKSRMFHAVRKLRALMGVEADSDSDRKQAASALRGSQAAGRLDAPSRGLRPVEEN